MKRRGFIKNLLAIGVAAPAVGKIIDPLGPVADDPGVKFATIDSDIKFTKPHHTQYTARAFYTHGEERMRIDTTGTVWIGTKAPNTKLEIK